MFDGKFLLGGSVGLDIFFNDVFFSVLFIMGEVFFVFSLVVVIEEVMLVGIYIKGVLWYEND